MMTHTILADTGDWLPMRVRVEEDTDTLVTLEGCRMLVLLTYIETTMAETELDIHFGNPGTHSELPLSWENWVPFH